MKVFLLIFGFAALALTPNLAKANELAATCTYKTAGVTEVLKSGETPRDLKINARNSNGTHNEAGSVTIAIAITNFLSKPTATVMLLGDDDQAQFVRLTSQNRNLEMSGTRGLGKYTLSCSVED